MGRGRSKIGGGKSASVPLGTPAPVSAASSTPSGVTYDQFMQMGLSQRYILMYDIANDPTIRVPSYLDGSKTTKIMYALGMSNKPTVVADSQLDTMRGREIFRTVYDGNGVTANDIIDQIRSGDFTQLSDSGGSAYGRALYFASDWRESALYSRGPSSRMCRGKVDPKANIVDYGSLMAQVSKSGMSPYVPDNIAMYALANGIDGWYDRGSGYNMILNRGVLTMSSTTKKIGRIRGGSWAGSQDG